MHILCISEYCVTLNLNQGVCWIFLRVIKLNIFLARNHPKLKTNDYTCCDSMWRITPCCHVHVSVVACLREDRPQGDLLRQMSDPKQVDTN